MNVLLLILLMSLSVKAMQEDTIQKPHYIEVKEFYPNPESTVVDCFFKKNDKGEEELAVGFNSRSCLFEFFNTRNGDKIGRLTNPLLFNTPGMCIQKVFLHNDDLYLITSPYIIKPSNLSENINFCTQSIYHLKKEEVFKTHAMNDIKIVHFFGKHIIDFIPENQLVISQSLNHDFLCRVERLQEEIKLYYPKSDNKKIRDIVCHHATKLAAMIIDATKKDMTNYRKIQVVSTALWARKWKNTKDVHLLAFSQEGDRLVCLTDKSIYQYHSENGKIITKISFNYDTFAKQEIKGIKDPKIYSITYINNDNELALYDQTNSVVVLFDALTGQLKQRTQYSHLLHIPKKITYPPVVRFNNDKTLKAVIEMDKEMDKLTLYKREK